jgi:hypothetical protein
MQKRIMIGLIGLCITLSLAGDQKPPVFYIGGKRLFIGMPRGWQIEESK